MKLRIAQIAPVWERVPPERYGGTEFVVSLLTEELVKRGHKVTLFATGDSLTQAELKWVYSQAQRDLHGQVIPEVLHLYQVFRQAERFDIIHNHAGYSACAFAALVKTPVLMTLHGAFTEENKAYFWAFRDALFYSTVSESQQEEFPKLNYIGTIYHGIDPQAYPFNSGKEDYLLSLGRISLIKGNHIAIAAAKSSGFKLILAGKVDRRDQSYFDKMVKPHLDGKKIVYLGEVSAEEKLQLLEKACGLLFPIQWEEPFGLVMLEAMACGTPVIAFRRGAAPEIIAEGKTGFIVESLDDMVKAIGKLNKIKPIDCKQHVAQKFNAKRMTDEYEKVYWEIINRRKLQDTSDK